VAAISSAAQFTAENLTSSYCSRSA
jgi:hypothetical protein